MNILRDLKRLRSHDQSIGSAMAELRQVTAERARVVEELRTALREERCNGSSNENEDSGKATCRLSRTWPDTAV